jgi:hypothetical protein
LDDDDDDLINYFLRYGVDGEPEPAAAAANLFASSISSSSLCLTLSARVPMFI